MCTKSVARYTFKNHKPAASESTLMAHMLPHVWFTVLRHLVQKPEKVHALLLTYAFHQGSGYLLVGTSRYVWISAQRSELVSHATACMYTRLDLE